MNCSIRWISIIRLTTIIKLRSIHPYLYYYQEDDYQVKIPPTISWRSTGLPARDSPPRRTVPREYTYCCNFLSWSIKVHQSYDGSSNSYGQYGQSDCFLGGHEAASLPLVLHAAFKHAVAKELRATVAEVPLLLPHPMVKQFIVGTIQISEM